MNPERFTGPCKGEWTMDENKEEYQGLDGVKDESREVHKRKRGRVLRVAGIVAGAVILAGAGYLVYNAGQDDTPSAVQSEDGAVSLPQNPSLKMLFEEDTWYVENDGNVTMHDIEVRDTGGSVICDLGILSPSERAPCVEAGDRQDLVTVGLGPQDQRVEVGPS